MQPLRTLLLIEVEKSENKTPGGIVIYEVWADADDIGVVKAVGPQVKEVVVGQRVRFNPYAAMRALEEGDVMIKEADILAVM